MIEGASFVGNRLVPIATPTSAAASTPVRMHASRSQARRWPTKLDVKPAMVRPANTWPSAGGAEKFIINPGKDPATCFTCHLQQQANSISRNTILSWKGA